ncbi:MAG TPA: PIG-L family deacetylase [Longimicrobiales bacterium]|nr:PIG-L family deacetylase [Longimicrobiales bacterium]
MRKLMAAPLCTLLALLLPVPPATAPLHGQATVESDGAAALGVALRRLGTTKRVLMIAAHPDDENTALIAELALGDGADVAYLSLTRGEGGQNLIGPELQEGLGLIRSEELLAARRLDGARQFFTRAYDFGFSRSADVTFRHWPRDTLLADVVEVVRRFRPDIIVSIFSGTAADGHGQHQAAGAMAREAFTAAADPARFPEQLAGGLAPHAPAYLFQSLWRAPPDAPLRLATGDLDPLFGRSRFQIAMQSRSRHRSQDMGRAEPIGPQASSLTVVAGPFPDGARSLFAGLDTTLVQLARRAGVPAATLRSLQQYEAAVAAVRDAFNPLRLHDIVQPLARAVSLLDDLDLPDGEAGLPLRTAVSTERIEAADALRQAAGIVVDVVSDTQHPVAGEAFHVTATLWNGGASPVTIRDMALAAPPGWSVRPDADAGVAAGNSTVGSAGTARVVPPNTVVRTRYVVTPPADAAPTEPYFLRTPRDGSLYRWPVADSLRGAPFEPAPVRALLRIDAGADITVRRDAEYVDVDKAVGESRRPLLVVPAITVAPEPRILVIPADRAGARIVNVTVASAAGSPVAGTLRLDAPAGWSVEPGHAEMRLDRRGDSRIVRFTVTPPAGHAGHAELRASFDSDRGTFDRAHALIDYPHIRPHALYRDATVATALFPVRIADGLRVGYIEGAGDDGALALRQLGADVHVLDADHLAAGDLAGFHAIVAGIRAYEVRPDLIAHNQRLLDYAHGGGAFIVQYNKYELVEGGFMPFPATMSRPHGRITDPAAPVTLLEPAHPALDGPNRITSADFDGWVQERGLYYLASWDDRYTPLLSMADPGSEPLSGALIAGRVGNGWYVYTGLALFRQLPEAVPGAWRLLANLVSLGR